jgi:hypothetical protein
MVKHPSRLRLDHSRFGLRWPAPCSPFIGGEKEMRMFQSEADRRHSLTDIIRRLSRLALSWLYFCGWRLATMASDLISPKRLVGRLLKRSERPTGPVLERPAMRNRRGGGRRR